MSIEIEFDFTDFDRGVEKMKMALSDRNVEAALAVGGFEVANRAKELAPYKDGVLRQSIHVGGWNARPGTGDEPQEKHGDIGGNGKKWGSVQVLVGTNLVYARIQELGGSIKTNPAMIAKLRHIGYTYISQNKQYVTIKKQPYLRPAFHQTWRHALEKIKRVLRSFIRRQLR